MANLRLLGISAADSRTVKAVFSENVHPDISTGNVTISSTVAGVPDPKVLRVSVRENGQLVITTRPLTPFVRYRVTFKSIQTVQFRNVSETSFLLEDGRTNVAEILGAELPANLTRDVLVQFLQDNVYNLQRGSIIRTFLNSVSDLINRARYDIQRSKNDNYLSVIIQDERKVRGYGPWDRLNEEGAFEIIRVGISPENQVIPGVISFVSFPNDIITLQRTLVSEEVLEAGTGTGTFGHLTLTLENKPVTILKSVIINYSNGDEFEYDVNSLGYRLKNPRYDSELASTLLTLGDDQVQLSESVLDDSDFVEPGAGDTITVSYEYKNLGKIIDEESVSVTQVLTSVREAAPAFTNNFSLKFAPVTTANGGVAKSGGISFLDPASNTPFLTTHPAFLHEIPFHLSGLPKKAGEYSIDYETGRVFVFGAIENDGTGAFPPAMTYNYRNTFVEGLDYTYNPQTFEVVRSPIRDLAEQTASINFNFERTLKPGEDFVAGVHLEVLNERVGNRILDTGSLQTLNSPITNVFRVFNETTGEVYQPSRFNDTTVFFAANGQDPRILTAQRERPSFESVLNETLFTSLEFTNTSGVRIFKIPLANQNIISATEDTIGSSYNTSVNFSRDDIFQTELFFDGQLLTESLNTDRLEVGQYMIDYRNGIVYIGVNSTTTENIGVVSYKRPIIIPANPHILAISEIYYSISQLLGISKKINYLSFFDGSIVPSSFDVSDERFLNGDTTIPYTFNNGIITVSDDIKTIRHIFDAADLNNNIEPIDFAPSATSSANIITLDSTGIEQRLTSTVGVGLTITVPSASPGIVLSTVTSVIRTSDNTQLLDGYQTLSENTITLSGSSGASVGDVVDVIYSVVLNAASTPVVDYNRGDYFIDYDYLADEILVSYEYGDNVIDFRNSDALNEGDEYFVTYRVGALRDSLLANFGSLVDIPELNNFDTEFARERYRDALIGALQSFTKGPTLSAMKLLVSSITKIDPQIIESAFDVWSLGISHLFQELVGCPGNPQLSKGKFDNGIHVRERGQAITFPISSNLRLEEGTLEFDIIPEWNGLDNDATLTFKDLIRDGNVVESTEIFIGASGFNPTITNGEFSINRLDDDSPVGLPAAIFTKTGLFVYYDTDVKQWKVLVKEPTNGNSIVWKGKIVTTGEFYDVQFITDLGEISDIVRSSIDLIEFEFNIDGYDSSSTDGYTVGDGYIAGHSFDGIRFMSDDLHYLFDFATEDDRNRFSIFKDGRGFLNFEVWDRGNGQNQLASRRSSRKVSTDIQNWNAGEQHFIAITWKLNTSERQDEMHLFVDGFEVPNIIRYGGLPPAISTDRFRTVVPENVAGTVTKKAIAGNDLNTTQGLTTVSSSVDFQSEGIVAGDQIEIFETGFSTYTILNVLNNELILDANMPASLTDARFSVNPFSAVVGTEIDIYKNLSVFRITSDGYEFEIPGVRADIPGYQILRNALNQRVLKVTGNIEVGDSIAIKTLGLNHRRCRERVFLWNEQSILKTALPPPINLDDVIIRSVILPLTSIGPSNAALTGDGYFQATLAAATQPSNSTEGRTLTIRVTGGNVDFNDPTTVTINGTSTGGSTEVLTFSEPGEKTTSFKWMEITDIDVSTKPIVTSRDGLGIEIKETYSLTYPDGNNSYPVIRFSFQIQSGLNLQSDGSAIVSDEFGAFLESDVGNLLSITSPAGVAGVYEIQDRVDEITVRLDRATGAPFIEGAYGVFRVAIARSGFQNGFFTLERAGFTNVAYIIPAGYYEFDYASYLEIPFDPITQTGFIGNDFNLNSPAKAVIDEFRILKSISTDTRIGESLNEGERSITTDFSRVSPYKLTNDTLVLFDFNKSIPDNQAKYISFANKEFIQSSNSVNEKFGHSIVIKEKGLEFENKNRLTTNKDGMIEFWVSPRFDTYNDPVERVYFDAAADVFENVTSISKTTLKISGTTRRVSSVRLATDLDGTGTDYFVGGKIARDLQTITLGTSLPFQNTPIKVIYTPNGLQGDRLTISKDKGGFLSFKVQASGSEFELRQPILWPRDSWHRVRVQFIFNRIDNNDEIRLFVDGDERNTIMFGDGLLFGQGFIFGQNSVVTGSNGLTGDINFRDSITRFSIGQDFAGFSGAQARIDNFKISNVAVKPLIFSGQPMDVYFNTNVNVLFPAIEDGYTTFLMDFERLSEIVTNFAVIRDPSFGIFNFVLNVIDSFDIVKSSARVEQALRAMVLALKPANAKVEINLID